MNELDKGTTKAQASRRRFLTGVAAAGGATAALAAGSALAATSGPVSEAPADDARSAGYQETAHVRAYYQSARM